MVTETNPNTYDRGRITYAYLRLGAAVPAIWLLLTLIWALLIAHVVRDSMSDYYGTPLRDVFVGSLMACGICMIAYKGQSWLEDYALNFAGINAFFVALVANSFQESLDASRVVQMTPLVSSQEVLDSLRASVWIFLAVMFIFFIVGRKLVKGAAWPRWSDQRGWAKALLVLSIGLEIVLLVIVASMQVSERQIFGFSVFSSVHFVSAFLLIGNLSLAAATHAFGSLHREGHDPIERLLLADALKQRQRWYFRVIVVAMWVGLVALVVGLAMDRPFTILVVEAWEIGLFLVFWLLATGDERGVPTGFLLR